ncbi:hypothetical protein ACMYSK_06910 [Klebsiella sp. I138]
MPGHHAWHVSRMWRWRACPGYPMTAGKVTQTPGPLANCGRSF